MLETLFQRPYHLRRIRANPIGAVVDPFAEYLVQRGYAKLTVHQFLRAIQHYGWWLATQQSDVTTEHVTCSSARQFLHEHLPVCSCTTSFQRGLVTNRAAINHLLRMLDRQDGTRERSSSNPHAHLLAQYGDFLKRDCGLSEHTRIYRLRNAREFLRRQFGDNPPAPDTLNSTHLQDYFRRYGGHLKPGSVAILASSLRSFLRFLALWHGFNPTLPAAVPTAPRWPMDRLPKILADSELRAVLAHFDTHTAAGRRDLAMMRCMSDLGLRVSEVTALTLDDLDWRSATLTLRGGKAGRGRTLPMPAPLGKAISAYLLRGRPQSTDRHLFLRHTVLAGTPVRHTLVRGVFRRAFAAATGRTDSIGTHVLRHTAATRMRAKGNSLKGIADVLGHRSVDTTAIYVKLDVEALRTVARPWPGGVS